MKDIITGLLIFIATIGAMAFFFDTCNVPSAKTIERDTVIQYRTDTFTFSPPPVFIYVPAKTRLILSPSGGGNVDSLRAMIAVRDSLKRELQKYKVQELLTLDTITNNRDTISIKADCINTSLSLLFRPSLQKITVQIPEKTITKTVYENATFWEKAGYFALGFGVGFGVQELRK